MTTPTEHINELLSGENLRLKDELETALSCYNDLVSAIEQRFQDYIVDDDVAAIAIYLDALQRVDIMLPRWTFLKGTKDYPEEGQLVIVAYVDDTDGDAKSVEAKWEDGEWVTCYPCLNDIEPYAWMFLLTPPNPPEE